MIIFITGEHAAGKTELAQFLQENMGFGLVDLGPTLRQHWQKERPDLSFSEFIVQGESVFGNNFTDELLLNYVKQKYTQLEEGHDWGLLVVGSRSLNGLRYLRDGLNSHGLNCKTIWIEADESTLFARYCKRENKQLTYDEFQQLLGDDRKRGVLEIRSIADLIIMNESTIGNLHEKTINFLGSIDTNSEGLPNLSRKENGQVGGNSYSRR